MKRNILLALSLFLSVQLHATQYHHNAPPAYTLPAHATQNPAFSWIQNANGYWQYVRNHTSPTWLAIGASALTTVICNYTLHDELTTPAAKLFTNTLCLAPLATTIYLLGRKFRTWVDEQVGENVSPAILITGGSVLLAGLLALKNKCASLDNIAEVVVGKSTDAFQAMFDKHPGSF